MIKYPGGSFSFPLLFRLHGSAVFRALIPSLISTALYAIFFHTYDFEAGEEDPLFDHPYPVAVLIAAFTFLLTFKASFSYNRYWEACTVIHQMQSKWLDVGMELAAFHLQSDRFRQKPPAFGAYPQVKAVIRERERLNAMTKSDLEHKLEETESDPSLRSRLQTILPFRKKKNVRVHVPDHARRRTHKSKNINVPVSSSTGRKNREHGSNEVSKEQNPFRLPKRFNPLHSYSKGKRCRLDESLRTQSVILSLNIEKDDSQDDKSVFLQEGAHLISLLSAVAMTTLRVDLEEAESPLAEYEPGAPWPAVDPDCEKADVLNDWEQENPVLRSLRFLLGMSRTPRGRTLYNAARPFRVVGGVSDAEVRVLQAARGPLAKVALCTIWLQEFITREYLAGSFGNVAPPIISRLYQFTSDGMLGYNQARKIAYIPFPFPHAQITSMFVLVLIVLIPFLMLSFVRNMLFGSLLNFCTVLCFTGLHEVSRELESPFQNAPNDIPLNNFQAQFNEALQTMFFGYHPDAWWVVEEQALPAPSPDTDTVPALPLRDVTDHLDSPTAQLGLHEEHTSCSSGARSR